MYEFIYILTTFQEFFSIPNGRIEGLFNLESLFNYALYKMGRLVGLKRVQYMKCYMSYNSTVILAS